MLALIPDPVFWLFAVAILLYLVDRGRLLFANEVVFFRQGNRWQFRMADQYPTILRRHLCLCSPHAPHRPVLFAAWPRPSPVLSAKDNPVAAFEDLERDLLPLREFCLQLLLLIFVQVPFFYWFAGSIAIIGGAIIAYLLVLLMSGWMTWRLRHRISKWRLAGLVFESVVCLPCAINLYFKILQVLSTHNREPLQAGRERLSIRDQARLRGTLRALIRKRLEWTDGEREQRRYAEYADYLRDA